MFLRQTLSESIAGYWDGGKKSVFNWHIEGHPATDTHGQYVRVGSWEANHWFHVALGRTTKQTLANARRRLQAGMRRGNVTGTFEYIED